MKGQSKLLTVMFDQAIPATGEYVHIDAERFYNKGRIVAVNARFYAGEENTLLVQPVLVDAQGTEDPLIQTVGDKKKGYISGENDQFEMSIDTPFQVGDRLRVWAVNESEALDNNEYPVKLWITYYFEEGK